MKDERKNELVDIIQDAGEQGVIDWRDLFYEFLDSIPTSELEEYCKRSGLLNHENQEGGGWEAWDQRAIERMHNED